MANQKERLKSNEKSGIDLIGEISPLPTSGMQQKLKRKKPITKVTRKLAQTKKEPAMYIDFPSSKVKTSPS